MHDESNDPKKAWILIWFVDTLPKTNTAPENRPSEKEPHLPTLALQVLCYVNFREGISSDFRILFNTQVDQWFLMPST